MKIFENLPKYRRAFQLLSYLGLASIAQAQPAFDFSRQGGDLILSVPLGATHLLEHTSFKKQPLETLLSDEREIRISPNRDSRFFSFKGEWGDIGFIDDLVVRSEIIEYTPLPEEDQGKGWRVGLGISYTPNESELALKVIPEKDSSKAEYHELDSESFFLDYESLPQNTQTVQAYLVAKGKHSTDDKNTWHRVSEKYVEEVPFEFLRYTPSRIGIDDKFFIFGTGGTSIADLKLAATIQSVISPELAEQGFTTYDVLFDDRIGVNPNGGVNLISEGIIGFFFPALFGRSQVNIHYDSLGDINSSILINNGPYNNSGIVEYKINGNTLPLDLVNTKGKLALINLSPYLTKDTSRTTLEIRAVYSDTTILQSHAEGYGIARIGFFNKPLHFRE